MSMSREKLTQAITLYKQLSVISSHPATKQIWDEKIAACENCLASNDSSSIQIFAEEIILEELEDKVDKLFLDKYENGMARLNNLKSCLTRTDYSNRRNRLNVLYFSEDYAGLSNYVHEMEKNLENSINAYLDKEELSFRRKNEKELENKEKKTQALIQKQDMARCRATAKNNYDKLADLCPEQRKYYCKKSEELTENSKNYKKPFVAPTPKKMKKLNTFLEDKISSVQSRRMDFFDKLYQKHILTWELFGTVFYTRWQLQDTLDALHPLHKKVESFIIFLEYYQKIKKDTFTLFGNNNPKISLAGKLLNLLDYNEKITLTYSELGILIDTHTMKDSLLKQMIKIFYFIKELKGFRQAVSHYCVLNKKNRYELDEKIPPDFEIQIDQANLYVLPDQEFHEKKSPSSCIVS